MNIFSTWITISQMEIKRMKEKPPAFSLLNAIEDARQDWQMALREMDHIDDDLAEYVIFKMNAAERRYMALLAQARKEGVTAWQDLGGPCSSPKETSPGEEDVKVKNASICS